MGRNLHKLRKVFDDVIGMLILLRHQNSTAEKIEDFRRFWLNISKKVRQTFQKIDVPFRQSCIKVFEIKRLEIGHSLSPW